MHIPKHFKQEDSEKLYELVRNFPFATLVTSQNGKLDVNHLPFYLKNRQTLQSHIARGNPLWQNCADGQEALLIFHGPNAYVSPNFYSSKKQNKRVVPTWNYSVVHVYGEIVFKQQSSWLMQLLEDITSQHEATQPNPWAISDAPASYIDTMIKAVVGVEICVKNIVGNFKLSQNKTVEDQKSVIQGLEESQNIMAKVLAAQMKQLYRTKH